MKNYKGYEIESEWINSEGYFLYHIKKDGEYIKTYLPSERACKLYISKICK